MLQDLGEGLWLHEAWLSGLAICDLPADGDSQPVFSWNALVQGLREFIPPRPLTKDPPVNLPLPHSTVHTTGSARMCWLAGGEKWPYMQPMATEAGGGAGWDVTPVTLSP